MENIKDFYRGRLERITQRIDTSIVLQMQRIIALTIDDIFVPLTCRSYESVEWWNRILDIDLSSAPLKYLEEYPVMAPGTIGKYPWHTLQDASDTQREFQRLPQTNVPIADVLAENSFVVLLGDPGSGKSTLLRWMVHLWTQSFQGEAESLFRESQSKLDQSSNLLPVPLTLRYFAQELSNRPNLTLTEFLKSKAWEQLSDGRNAEIGKYVLDEAQKGRCLFLLDGLDEAIDSTLRQRVVEAILTFLRLAPGCRYVITSRIIGYELTPAFGPFSEWVLEPFKARQIGEFFQKWSLAVERHEDISDADSRVDDFVRRRAQQRASQILQGIGVHASGEVPQQRSMLGVSRLEELAQNPMLCTLIGLIHHQGKRLPEDRCELYRLCIEAFIYDWEIQKRTLLIEKQALDKFETLDVLEELAFRLHSGTSENRVTHATLKEIIQEFLEREKGISSELARSRAKHQIDLIHGRAGLLVERGENEFGFSHLQFQEYLAGRALTRRRSEVPGLLRQFLWRSRWEEPIMLAAGHRAQHSEEAATEFLEAILRTPPPDEICGNVNLEGLLHRGLLIAGRCLHDAKRVHFKTRKEIFDGFGRIFADTKRPYLWKAAARALENIGTNEITSTLMNNLVTADDVRIRAYAAAALGELGAGEAASALANALRNDTAVEVRWRSLSALTKLQTSAVEESLIHSLTSDTDGEVRRRAAVALGAVHSESSIQDLLTALKSDLDPGVRKSAAAALASIGSMRAIEPLLQALLEDKSRSVRRAAIAALAKLPLMDAPNATITALKDNLSKVDSILARVVAGRKGDQMIGPLLELLDAEKSDVTRIKAAETLSILGHEKAGEYLLNAMSLKLSSGVVKSIIQALGKLRYNAGIEKKLRAVLMQNPSASLRGAAAQALGNIGAEESVPALMDAICSDAVAIVRRRAARALGRMRFKGTSRRLMIALSNESDAGARGAIVDTLAASGARDSAKSLETILLDDPHPAVRRKAAEGLGVLREAKARDALVRALQIDAEPSVRGSAAMALGEMREESAIPPLMEIIRNHECESLQIRAIRALGKIRSKTVALELATKLLDNSYSNVWPELDLTLREIFYG